MRSLLLRARRWLAVPLPERSDIPGDETHFLARRFRLVVGALCLFYLAIQLVYVSRLPLCEDEFAYAAFLHRLPGNVPYRDFKPYRTVLGYYVYMPPMKLPLGLFGRVVATKVVIALVNTGCLAAAAVLLARRFRREAVCLGLGLLVAMSTFLERSSELRVDMLSSWLGLASFLLVLERKPSWAGALAGLSFFVSPKGAYFILAGDAALASYVLFVCRDRAAARDLVIYNAAAFAVLVAYVGFWSIFAAPRTVIEVVFFKKAAQLGASYDAYDVGWCYWGQTLRRNPFFYWVGLAGLFEVFRRILSGTKDRGVHVHASYATVLTVLVLSHRFPWTYFFVTFIPTVWVLAVAFFDARASRPGAPPLGLSRAALVLCAVAGVVYPMTRLGVTLRRDAGFQKDTVRLADSLLGPGEQYFAGVPVVYDREQPVFDWLDRVGFERLRRESKEKMDTYVEAMNAAPLKLYIHTDRMRRLPLALRRHFRNHFAHLRGNVYIYGPTVRSGENEFHVKFDGTYELAWAPAGRASIDGSEFAEGERLALARGVHRKSNESVFRLKLLPEGFEALADPRYRDPWAFFTKVFRY